MSVIAPEASLGSPPGGIVPTPGGGTAPLVLVPSQCFLCEDDDADPVAVGQDFDLSSSPETFLAVRCRRCGLVYLNPAATLYQVEHPPSPDGVLGREITRFRHKLADSARVLDVRGIEDFENASGVYDG